MEWRYHAFRLEGNGRETPIAWDLELGDVQLLRSLNGAGGLDARVEPEILRMTSNGDPVFVPWSTAIYAEASGQIRGAGIVTDITVDGPQLAIACTGFTGYLDGLPFTGEFRAIDVDPLDVARKIWSTVQAQPGGNLGMHVAGTKSRVRIGAEANPTFTKTGGRSDGPYTLNWWSTDNLLQEFEALATETPFDYRETHKWEGERVKHSLDLGAPTLGGRRDDLRFVVGENVLDQPRLSWGEDEYASEVIVMGAGEGRDMIRGIAQQQKRTRLRRPKVVKDSSIRSGKRATALAEQELRKSTGDADFEEITVRNHPNAPLGSWQMGDEILVQTEGDWHGAIAVWVRVLSDVIDPGKDQATIRVTRVERVTA